MVIKYFSNTGQANKHINVWLCISSNNEEILDDFWNPLPLLFSVLSFFSSNIIIEYVHNPALCCHNLDTPSPSTYFSLLSLNLFSSLYNTFLSYCPMYEYHDELCSFKSSQNNINEGINEKSTMMWKRAQVCI